MIRQFTIVSSLVLLVGAQHGVVITKEPIHGVTGKDYVFQCTQTRESGPAPDLSWDFEGNAISNDSKYSVENVKDEEASSTVSNLTIKNAQLEDDGTYNCHGHESSATAELILAPSVTVTVTDVEGGFILAKGTKIGCVVKGNTSNDNVEWSIRGTKLIPGKQDINGDEVDDVELSDGNILEFLTDDENLVGEYNCTKTLADNIVVFDVHVIGTDIDIDVPMSIKVSEGEDGDITCKATSIPLAKITFYHEGQLITDGFEDRYKIMDKPALQNHEVIKVLTIKKVEQADATSPNYTCTASNGAVEKSQIVLLRIRDRLAALWPFIGIVSEVIILIVIILIHEACTKGEDIGEVDDDEEDHLLQKDRTITRDGERETRMRGTNN